MKNRRTFLKALGLIGILPFIKVPGLSYVEQKVRTYRMLPGSDFIGMNFKYPTVIIMADNTHISNCSFANASILVPKEINGFSITGCTFLKPGPNGYCIKTENFMMGTA